ncbi:MAG TPA: ATP-binding protein [Gemmatimonadales bacterium]|nr:ATP-binding protein [Gemmatimonadales bacterium]
MIAANRATTYGTVSRWLLHDLRNPTQALTLITELMGGAGGQDAEVEETVRGASAHLGRLLELMDRALRHPARPAASPAPIALRPVLEFVSAVVRLHRSAVRVDAAEALEAPLPALACAEDDLEHALLNLVLNSIDAMVPGGGTIRIGAAPTEAQLRLTVEDDGPGVEPAIRPRLFEPFATTRDRPLAGLGLPAARELLRRSGGTIEHIPAPHGTRFDLRVPAWVR